MTWPPNGEHKAVEELEKPDPTRAPTPLAHNDLHMENSKSRLLNKQALGSIP